MSTTGARLVFDSGLAGGTASVLLKAMGAGATAGARLVAYSRLGSNTAMIHLLANPQTSVRSGGGGGTAKYYRRPKYWWEQAREEALVVPDEIPVPQDLSELQEEQIAVEAFVADVQYDRRFAETVRVLTAYTDVLKEQIENRLLIEQNYGIEQADFTLRRKLRMRKIAMLLLN